MTQQPAEVLRAAPAQAIQLAAAAPIGRRRPVVSMVGTFLISLLALMIVGFVLLEADLLPGVPATSPLARAVHALKLINLVPIFGGFGGLLYAMRANSVVQPHREGEHGLNLGWIADLGFGVGGAFVVFLVVPGTFNVEAGGWDTFKAFSVALVGGYAGRAMIAAKSKEYVDALKKEMAQNKKDVTESVSAVVSARLDRTTEAVTRMFSSQALRLEEYVAELRRIIDKDEVKDVSVIYADVDGLRRHLSGRRDERAVRALVLEQLELALEHAVAERGYKWDMFSVFPAVSDRILVVRGATLQDAALVADRARTFFKDATRGRSDLALQPGEMLTISAGVACSSGQALERMSLDAERRLKSAKDGGHDRVVAEERPLPTTEAD